MRARTILIIVCALINISLGGCLLNRLSFKRVIDNNLAKYYDAYYQAVNRNCYMREYEDPNQITVIFETLSNDDVGQCGVDPFSYIIKIDPDAWAALNEKYRYELMFHEASHCIFRQEHVSDSNNIMYPSLVELPEFQVFYQAEEIIKSHCSLWRNREFIPIETRD